jgi:hypothetical protein
VMHKDLAVKTVGLRHLQSDFSYIKKQFASNIEKADGEIESLADKINSGFEHRQMTCLIVFEWDKGVKFAIHPETGEVIKTMDITADDKQQKLEFDKQVEEAAALNAAIPSGPDPRGETESVAE